MGNGQGILSNNGLLDLVESGILRVPNLKDGQIQPASMDITLGDKVTCVNTSFLPQPDISIEEIIKEQENYSFELDDKKGLLVKGQTYIIELQESIALPPGFRGSANPKSSTGRADIWVRLLTEGGDKFDTIPHGKNPLTGEHRKMFLEVTPLSFDAEVKKGTPLAQMRVEFGNAELDESALRVLHERAPLLFDYEMNPFTQEMLRFDNGGLDLTFDLKSDIVGYKAKTSSQLKYDLSGGRGSMADKKELFWEAIPRPKDGKLVLEPDSFYLLATRERTSFSDTICGVLQAYDVNSGEFRSHYAGYFDKGFGRREGTTLLKGTPGTLEVRTHHKPMLIRDKQRACNMKYMMMQNHRNDKEEDSYGAGKYSSNYQNQPPGPTMGKQFLAPK